MIIPRYMQYLSAVAQPFRKIAKLDFLQPDNSIAFTLDNTYRRGYNTRYDTRAFLQDGTLNVSLQNGTRRNASITLSNLDGAFDYAVNKIWFGRRVRLSMGLILPDGSDFYLPQGVFYLQSPTIDLSPNARTVTYNLVDKWAYLDGTLFGNLENTYQVNASTATQQSNIFDAMAALLKLSRIDFSSDAPFELQIDNVTPVFTTYYNDPEKTYTLPDGRKVTMTDVPYTVTVGSDNGTFADVLLELNTMIAGWIGYDQTGALRVEPSQDDFDDSNKPISWNFSPENSKLNRMTQTIRDTEVYNDVIITGEGLSGYEVYGRATNIDPASDTNVNLIGKKTYREARASYWNADQCVDLANFFLKRKTVLQKSVSIECAQMFHLMENRLVSVTRTDKPGNPIEKHIIQSFSLPIGETGSMSISALSVNDLPNLAQITSSGNGGSAS